MPSIYAAHSGASMPENGAYVVDECGKMEEPFMGHITRRQALKGIFLAGGAMAGPGSGLLLPRLFAALNARSVSEGQLLGTLEFAGEPPAIEEKVFGQELDGRLYTDLSVLDPKHPVTPTEKFYIRTLASRLLPGQDKWNIQLSGFGERAASLSMGDLHTMAQPRGVHLMECSGNGPFARFGMISVADWAGVPLMSLLERSGIKREARRVLVSGFDTYASKPATSIPGASWIFTLDEISSAQAFLATSMNGQPLTPNHGSPVRLVVPGWYGCVCIKWVNEIALVEDGATATSQMREFASRTHQAGVPVLARDYEPAVIDPAAMPVRIEKWLVAGKITYRVLGILWGISRPIHRLEIQFDPDQPFVPVTQLSQTREDSWSFWTYDWQPASPGRYSIRLRVQDLGVRTRRLDMNFYRRSVDITGV
jgi:DMSO/TMAO reductase YedYZ molybdopterin-dependent catalytic subunit